MRSRSSANLAASAGKCGRSSRILPAGIHLLPALSRIFLKMFSPLFAESGGARRAHISSVHSVKLSKSALEKLMYVRSSEVTKSAFRTNSIMSGRWSELSAVTACQVVKLMSCELTRVISGELLQLGVILVGCGSLMGQKSVSSICSEMEVPLASFLREECQLEWWALKSPSTILKSPSRRCCILGV